MDIQEITQNMSQTIDDNRYDWLGDGIYFGENNLARAWQYAEIARKRKNSLIKTPYVFNTFANLKIWGEGNEVRFPETQGFREIRFAQ
jgi:hypothetical protein